MLDYAFSHVDKVIFMVGDGNLRSQHAITKLGAMRSAVIADATGTSYEFTLLQKNRLV
jgi:hypothetical protein